MNFSEYVAILSGNTDLLDKARLEKKIAALESEKKAFGRNKANSEHKLASINGTISGNSELIARMTKDLDNFNSRVKRDKDGNVINSIKLDGVESADVKVIAAKLAHINEHATTHGNHYEIGTLYGFKLLVKTENSQKNELFKENKFYAEGEGSVKHTYNNGKIANDPKLAVNYFLNALEKIPSLIEKYKKDTEKLNNDVPVLQEVVNSTWRKENELKDLKTELAALDRKIQLSLKPIDNSEEAPAEKQNVPNVHFEQNRTAPDYHVTSKNTLPDNNEKSDHEKGIEAIHALFSGKISPSELNRMQQAKEEMGDRLQITSIPTYSIEINSKGFKI